MAQAYLGWINHFYKDVYARMGGTPDPLKDPNSTVDGCYYNYPDSVLGTHEDGRIDQALWLYFLDNSATTNVIWLISNALGLGKLFSPSAIHSLGIAEEAMGRLRIRNPLFYVS